MANKVGVVDSYNPAGKKVGNRGSSVYSFKLDDGEWYRTGFEKPPAELSVGDSVKFSYTEDQYGKQVDLSTLKIKKNPNPAAQSTGGSTGGNGKDDYWKAREERDIEIQKRIGYAGCLNSAIALAEVLIPTGAFPVSDAKLKSKDGLPLTQAVLVQLADEFWALVNNRPDELAEMAEAAQVANGADDLSFTEAEVGDADKDPDDFDDWGDDN